MTEPSRFNTMALQYSLKYDVEKFNHYSFSSGLSLLSVSFCTLELYFDVQFSITVKNGAGM